MPPRLATINNGGVFVAVVTRFVVVIQSIVVPFIPLLFDMKILISENTLDFIVCRRIFRVGLDTISVLATKLGATNGWKAPRIAVEYVQDPGT